MADYSGAIAAIKACSGKKRRAYRKCLKAVRKTSKHINKTEHKVNKWDALEVGYQNGIDGRASVAKGFSDSVKAVGDTVASIYGGKAAQDGKTERTESIMQGFGGVGTIVGIIGILITIVSIFKR